MTDEKDDKLEAGERIHPDAQRWAELQFEGGGTVSGRFSSSNPNFREQLPSHGPEAVSPTGRLSRSMPKFQELPKNTTATATTSALTGKQPSMVIIDDPEDATASKLALALKDLDLFDLSDIELRYMAATIDMETWADDMEKLREGIRKAGFDFGVAVRQLGQAFKAPTLSATELGLAMHKHMLDNPELYMSKDERRHSRHPTEKNPNHPRFQNQPTKPRRNRQRKQK